MIKTIIGVVLAATITTTNAATLLYQNGFNGGLGDITKMYECDKNKNHAFILSENPRREGSHSLGITSYGDEGDKCPEYGGKTYKHRVQAQLGIGKSYPGYPKGLRIYPDDSGPWWVGFSVYVPSKISTGMFIIFDIKSASSHFGEPTAFFHLNRLDVRIYGDKGNDPRFTLPRDQWVDIVWMIDRRKDSKGRMKFWLNGKLSLDQTGQTIPSDLPEVESWFRIGVYYGDDRPGHFYKVYFDNVKIARGEDGYGLVAPSSLPEQGKIPLKPIIGITQ